MGTSNTQALAQPQPDSGAALAIMAMTGLGIFLVWFPLAYLQVPLPTGVVARSMTTGLAQTATFVVLPYLWASRRLRLSPADLGLTTRNLLQSTLLGCGLYGIAFLAFVHSAHDPAFMHHAARTLPLDQAMVLTVSMCIVAAGTDLATRGFVLLGLSRYTHVAVAIIAQDTIWLLGHIAEIGWLSRSMGLYAAVALTLVLGLLGDIVALRTRNVTGLAIAHVLLNVATVAYLRHI